MKDVLRIKHRLPETRVIDDLAGQIEELFYVRHPQVPAGTAKKKEIIRFAEVSFGYEKETFGTWVYYPWNDYLVRFLPEELHQELRTSRNRNLITAEDQEKYSAACVGIAGLSIGNSITATLVHTGGPNHLKLADFDTLSASNTNRIRTGFTNLGRKKTRIAAEEAYEVNPYLKITSYDNGLNPDLLEEFLMSPRLDVLVEEMDSIYLKIQIRILAKRFRIPVVMATDNGDNVLIDIERFDEDPGYPLFHGVIPEKELLSVTPSMPKPEAARMITRWVGPENVDIRMQKSLLELGKTLYTWPQLGTAAFLSGVAAAIAVRGIITGLPVESGKFIISPYEDLMPVLSSKTKLAEKDMQTMLFKRKLNLL